MGLTEDIVGSPAVTTVMVAVAVIVVSATEVAVMVTASGSGTFVALYWAPVDVGWMVPTAPFPPGMPFTLQVTAVFVVPDTATAAAHNGRKH